MLQATRTHQDVLENAFERTIRIGKTVPDGGVNLAYFHNNQVANGTSVLIADAPKQTINHEQVEKVVHKTNLPTPSNNHFEEYILHQNASGYAGYLKRQSVEWQDTLNIQERNVTIEENFITATENIPKSKNHAEDGFTGTLLLQNKILTPETTEEVTKTVYAYKESSRMLEISDLEGATYDWPEYYVEAGSEDIFEDGYEGKLKLDESSIRYYKHSVQEPGQAVSKILVFEPGQTVPEIIEEDGITYHLKAKENVIGAARYYGFSRYYGRYYGAGDQDGIYGEVATLEPYDAENKYVTDENGNEVWGRGFFSDRLPRIKPGIHASSSFEPYVEGVMPDYNTFKYAEPVNNSTWMLDLSKSITGAIWADTWDKKQAFPPEGYKPVDGASLDIETGIKPDMSKVNMGYFNDPQGRDAYYAPGVSGADTKAGDAWFRDIIVFYKDNEVKTRAYYVGYLDDGTKETWRASAKYVGVLKKGETKTELIVNTWNCKATYSGVCRHSSATYSGTAIYQGTLSKQISDGNVDPVFVSEFKMVANGNGILEQVNELDGTRSQALSSDHFAVTNHFKDGVPLLYEGRLTYPFYHPQQPDKYEYYQGNSIKLLNASGRRLSKSRKYQIKLQPVEGEKDLYWVYIYTNFQVTSQNPVYAVYNAYDLKGSGASRVKIEHKESLNVQPFFIVRQSYSVQPIIGQAGNNQIVLNEHENIQDTRYLPIVSYKIVAVQSGIESQPITAAVLNRRYALSKELKDFNGRKQNISPLSRLNQAMTPIEIILRDNPALTEEQIALLKNDLFKAVKLKEAPVEGHEADVLIHVQSNGQGIVEAETAQDTGFFNPATGRYDLDLKMDHEYLLDQGFIKPVYYVKCLDTRSLQVEAPIESGALENWYPRVKYGRFTHLSKRDGGVPLLLTYSLPEYHNQFYSPTKGKPFVDITKEPVRIIDEYTIKTSKYPLTVFRDETYQPNNLFVYKVLSDGTKKKLSIRSWSYSEGLVYLDDVVNENDQVLIDYTYEEEYVTYRGYRYLQTFYDLDLNPNVYHTFKDPRYEDGRRSNVYELFNSIVYLFVKPSVIQQLDHNGEPIHELTLTNDEVIYHKINDDTPNSSEDLLIGSIYVRHNTSLHSTVLMDTRVLGGGLIAEIDDQLRRELEPESDHYWDIGYWDGKPYSENAVIIIRLDRRLLVENGGRFTEAQIHDSVHQWVAAGVIPIIEFVTTYTADELPQASLEIESTILEQTEETIQIFAEAQTVHQQTT